MQKQFKEYLLTKNYRPIYNLAKEKLKPIKDEVDEQVRKVYGNIGGRRIINSEITTFPR